MKKQFIYFLICIAILLSCSTDDGIGGEKIVLRGIEGKVLRTISCQTENNGLAYEIEIKNLESPTKIRVLRLAINRVLRSIVIILIIVF